MYSILKFGDWEISISISKFPNRTFPNYFVLKLLTGFANAALTAWKLTLINAITIDAIPATINNHQLNSILYAKFSSHLCMKYQANGADIAKAIVIRNTNSFENKYTMFEAVAPNTFLIPTSL